MICINNAQRCLHLRQKGQAGFKVQARSICSVLGSLPWKHLSSCRCVYTRQRCTELRCLSSVDEANGRRAESRASSCFPHIIASVSFADYGRRRQKRENTVSPFSLGKHTRMYTYACNEVEDEVVRKVVYSINGTARTCADLTARCRVFLILQPLSNSGKLSTTQT